MGADQQTWDYGVTHTGKKSRIPEPIPVAHGHHLEFSDRRWRCACGYTLGDGRQQFLAECVLKSTRAAIPELERANYRQTVRSRDFKRLLSSHCRHRPMAAAVTTRIGATITDMI